MKSVRKKQLIVLLLVVIIVAAGFLQYNYNKSMTTGAGVQDEQNMGEATYVNSNDDKDDNDSEDNVVIEEVPTGNDQEASVEANSFFAQAKLERDIEFSKNSSYLKDLSTDAKAEKSIQEKAYTQFVTLVEESECKARIETLIKEKGFEDAFIAFGNDGSVDVIIKASTLNESDVAQVSDIVSRQAKKELPQIHIRNIY